MIELRKEDVGVHAIGNSPKGRGNIERVYVYPALGGREGRNELRYSIPSHYRIRSSYMIRIFDRQVKADGLEIYVWVVVVRRRSQ